MLILGNLLIFGNVLILGRVFPKIIFSLGQQGCAYNEWGQYFFKKKKSEGIRNGWNIYVELLGVDFA